MTDLKSFLRRWKLLIDTVLEVSQLASHFASDQIAECKSLFGVLSRMTRFRVFLTSSGEGWCGSGLLIIWHAPQNIFLVCVPRTSINARLYVFLIFYSILYSMVCMCAVCPMFFCTKYCTQSTASEQRFQVFLSVLTLSFRVVSMCHPLFLSQN